MFGWYVHGEASSWSLTICPPWWSATGSARPLAAGDGGGVLLQDAFGLGERERGDAVQRALDRLAGVVGPGRQEREHHDGGHGHHRGGHEQRAAEGIDELALGHRRDGVAELGREGGG